MRKRDRRKIATVFDQTCNLPQRFDLFLSAFLSRFPISLAVSNLTQFKRINKRTIPADLFGFAPELARMWNSFGEKEIK